MAARIAVIYYSSTGHLHQMAEAVAEGAREAGAEVRLRRVPELAPMEVVNSLDAWREHYEATKDTVEVATHDDLVWADGLAFGTPTRFGNPTSQLKQFLDTTGPLWAQGKLADKAATTFTSSKTLHGGQESTILAVNNVLYHWGAVIIPIGYTDPVVFAAGGNPYGASWTSDLDEERETSMAAARYQGRRLAGFAERLASTRPELVADAD